MRQLFDTVWRSRRPPRAKMTVALTLASGRVSYLSSPRLLNISTSVTCQASEAMTLTMRVSLARIAVSSRSRNETMTEGSQLRQWIRTG